MAHSSAGPWNLYRLLTLYAFGFVNCQFHSIEVLNLQRETAPHQKGSSSSLLKQASELLDRSTPLVNGMCHLHPLAGVNSAAPGTGEYE